MDPLAECLAEVPQGGLLGNDGVTQLRECLSSKTTVSLCNAGFGEKITITVLIKEVRRSVKGNLNKLSQRVELSTMR